MAKTKEELNALTEEVKALQNKLSELSEEELQEVSGGIRLAVNKGPDKERVIPILLGAEDHNVML